MQNSNKGNKTSKKIETIKNIINKRIESRKQMKMLEGNTYKIITNFEQIAENYAERIKNQDLLSSDPTRKFYETSRPTIY